MLVPVQARGEDRDTRTELRSVRHEIKKYRDRLKSTRDRRQQTQNKLAKTRQKEKGLLDLLEDYNRRIDRLENQAEKQRRQARKAQRKYREVQKRLEQVKQNLRSRRKLLYQRLRSIYKQGELMHGKVLLGASDMSDFLTRLRFYRELIVLDHRVIEQYRETRNRLDYLEEQRRGILERRRQARKRARRKLSRLKETREHRSELLERVREKKALYRQRIEELQQQQEKLKKMVFDLQEKRSRAKGKIERGQGEFGALQGELSWPVESREILRPFGSWWDDGVQHENDGLDIAVEEGTRVQPVASGRVVFARRYRGMGKVVIVRHTEQYVSLYGSLVEINVEPGQTVKRGEVLGRAGETPGMGEPRVYLQLFQGRRILDPTQWLE